MSARGNVPPPVIRRSKLSESDYREIWHYIAADNPDAADALLRKIDAKLDLYAANPMMGTDRSRLGRGLRSFPVGNYLVFYKPLEDGIIVLRVVHGARNLRRLFRRR